jgi:hypothetical protein
MSSMLDYHTPHLSWFADCCASLRDHSQAFLLDSTPADLPQSLLLELQQHLQLHMLLPAVLLQWVADKPSTDGNYSRCCHLSIRAAQASGMFHTMVLQSGPPSLYQHMMGHSRPPFPTRPDFNAMLAAHAQQSTPMPRVLIPIPADVHACQLQLLGQILPNLLQLWRSKTSEAPPGQPVSFFGGSNSSTQRTGPLGQNSELVQAISSAGHWAAQMPLQPPPYGPNWQADDSVGTKAFHSSAASNAAEQLCALLENVCRMELSAGQQAPASGSSTSSGGRRAGLTAIGQQQAQLPLLQQISVREALHVSLSFIHHKLTVGPLVDPILVNHGPGSMPCKQLYSLLTTLLKCGKWDCSQAPAGSPRAFYAYTSCSAVFRAACTVIEGSTAEITGSPSTSGLVAVHSSSRCDAGSTGSSSSSHAAGQEVAAVLPWMVLLGHCCLQWGSQLAGAPSPILHAGRGMQFGSVASIKGKLAEAVYISNAWLSAGSHASQVAAMGYDIDGMKERLDSAATTSRLVDMSLRVGSDDAVVTLPMLLEQVQSVGIALTSFAHPLACNNPLCSNAMGPSESALVQGKTSRCSGCRSARYCGKACQVSHWKQHKHVCKRLAAAATAAAAKQGSA